MGIFTEECYGMTQIQIKKNGYPNETAEVSAILIILIKSEQFLADPISLHGNLTTTPSGQIHGSTHDAVTHPQVEALVFFFQVLPQLFLFLQMLRSAGTDQ